MTGQPRRPTALVITPSFFGYEKEIVAEFERQGFETTYIDERPSNSTFTRALLRARKELIGHQIDRYYRTKWTECGAIEFDVVFVERAEATPRWFLEYLRQANPHARFVFYIWDAVSKATNCLNVMDLFDAHYSFDPADVAVYPQLSYLPLFYTPDFSPLPAIEASQPRRFTLSYIGTLHPGRYAFVSKLFERRSNTFKFFYVQARWYFVVVKYLTREHRNVGWRDVSFDKLSRHQVATIFRESGAVLDMPQPGQTGLTMRTFEVLASGAILVTTNATIAQEPFYDPGRVFVVPEHLDEALLEALRLKLSSIRPPEGPPDSFYNYSLESWVRTMVTRLPVEAAD